MEDTYIKEIMKYLSKATLEQLRAVLAFVKNYIK